MKIMIICFLIYLALSTMALAQPTGPETLLQQKIVRLAKSKSGQSSGLSEIISGATWDTDVTTGGQLDAMGLAIREALSYCLVNCRNGKPEELHIAAMSKTLQSPFGSDAPTLARRISGRIRNFVGPFRPNPNLTAEDLIRFLEIRKQCLEWVVTTARQAGGQMRGYSSTAIKDSKEARAGMALFDGRKHAMLILSIQWSHDGRPISFSVAETNWASQWSHPVGDIPWQRNVGTGRQVIYNPAKHRIVSFE